MLLAGNDVLDAVPQAQDGSDETSVNVYNY